jgi:hypothetical protein
VTGFAAPSPKTSSNIKILFAQGTITLKFQDTRSRAGNYILTPQNADFVIPVSGDPVMLVYRPSGGSIGGGNPYGFWHVLNAPATPEASSGRYTPTASGVLNVDATTTYSTAYMRVGNTVTVGGVVGVDATLAAGTDTVFTLSLPVVSNIASTTDLGGAGAAISAGVLAPVAVYGNVAGDAAQFEYASISAANLGITFSFSYSIL